MPRPLLKGGAAWEESVFVSSRIPANFNRADIWKLNAVISGTLVLEKSGWNQRYSIIYGISPNTGGNAEDANLKRCAAGAAPGPLPKTEIT